MYQVSIFPLRKVSPYPESPALSVPQTHRVHTNVE